MSDSPGTTSSRGASAPVGTEVGDELSNTLSNTLSDEVIEGVFELARRGETAPLGEMIDAGVGIDTANARGDSLLIVAAYAQHPETVRELLRRGADTTTVNGMGQTAISCAVFRDDEEVLVDLLDAGADPSLGNPDGIQIAEQFGLPRMLQLLEEHAAS